MRLRNDLIRGAQASRLLVSAARRNSLCGQLHADGPTASTGEPPVLPEIKAAAAFTILELLVVIGIIITLAALILGTVGYVQKKGARSRAEAEIAAMSAALESYKADNGVYPATTNTNAVDARSSVNMVNYQRASLDLYAALTGDTNHDRKLDSADADPSAKSYLAFRPNMLSPRDQNMAVTAIVDPFGNSYGYSTIANATANPGAAGGAGYNPTFDLWSTAGTSGNNPNDPQWIKNW